MPIISEKSFADRLGRGRLMQAAIAAFTPTFTPADISLAPAAFNTFLDSVTALNTAVANAEATWKNNAQSRVTMVKDIKAKGLRILSRIKSNTLWKGQVALVKAAVDELRGYVLPHLKSPPDVTPPVMTKPKADQSYSDIKGLLDKVISRLAQASGYTTGAPTDITTLALTTLATTLDTLNKTIAANEVTLYGARAARTAAYDADDTGLKAKMLAIKSAALSQYTAQSSQYQEIKGIRV